MRKVLYTQRVEAVAAYGERRDCADQRIPKFLRVCGFLPVPMPNVPELSEAVLGELSIDGIFLTGGNNLAAYGGDAPERDRTERRLLDLAVRNGKPVFGICRGMQMIAHSFGAALVPCEGHVRVRHPIHGAWQRESVNSYHAMGIREAGAPLVVMGRSPDGMVEALRHESFSIAAVGWHPEREPEFRTEDVEMVRGFFLEGNRGSKTL